MLKKNIFGQTFISLTGAQMKEFIATGKTTHDEDGKRFYIVSRGGFPEISHFEMLKAELKQNPVVTFVGKDYYKEAGKKPYNGEDTAWPTEE